MVSTENRGYAKRAVVGFWDPLRVSAAVLAESKFLSLAV